MLRFKTALLVLFLTVTGLSISACETVEDAADSVKDTID